MERLLTLNEVSDYLGVPLTTLYQWRHAGTGPRGVKVGKHVRVRESDLLRWLDGRRDPQPAG